jgi:hypothetical protein
VKGGSAGQMEQMERESGSAGLKWNRWSAAQRSAVKMESDGAGVKGGSAGLTDERMSGREKGIGGLTDGPGAHGNMERAKGGSAGLMDAATDGTDGGADRWIGLTDGSAPRDGPRPTGTTRIGPNRLIGPDRLTGLTG